MRFIELFNFSVVDNIYTGNKAIHRDQMCMYL